MHTVVNTQQAQAWNGDEGRHWADHHDHWDAVSGGLNPDLLTAASIGTHDRVLDIGCGNGQTTRLAAVRAPQGHALGVDLSAPMLARARLLAAEQGIANARFEQGDAQVHPFPTGDADVAVSRGGVSFFTDPVAASPTSRAPCGQVPAWPSRARRTCATRNGSSCSCRRCLAGYPNQPPQTPMHPGCSP